MDTDGIRCPAFKEWAVVVQALLHGEQILDVRKGGIREDERHFSVKSNRFWLYPTVEHQRADLCKPAYARWVAETESAALPNRDIRIDGWADIVGTAQINDPGALDALDGRFIWTRDYVESRFSWKKRDPLWILALRVHRLRDSVTIPYRDEYGGCTSWVDLDGLPDDPASLPSVPALSQIAFASRLNGTSKVIPGGLEKPL